MNSPTLWKTKDNKRKSKGKTKPRMLQQSKQRLQQLKKKLGYC